MPPGCPCGPVPGTEAEGVAAAV
ncbi:hypothetical protein STRTUCAR8_06664, partial [Streptomyces turgidiscabies Car8]